MPLLTAEFPDTAASPPRSGHLEVHLIGGYCDEKSCSETLSLQLLKYFIQDVSARYVLQTSCIGSLNTTYRNQKTTAFPVVYGCAVDVETGEIFPAKFPDSAPEELIRHIRYERVYAAIYSTCPKINGTFLMFL